MVRISLQFSGFWRRFSKGEGIFATFQTFTQEIPKLAELESSLMLILFLFIKEGFFWWFDSCGPWDLFFILFYLKFSDKCDVFIQKMLKKGRLSDNKNKISNCSASASKC